MPKHQAAQAGLGSKREGMGGVMAKGNLEMCMVNDWKSKQDKIPTIQHFIKKFWVRIKD